MKVSIDYGEDGKDKVRVMITKDDLWVGDIALARVIYPFLKKYKKYSPSYPMDFGPDPDKPAGPDNPDRYDEWLICLDKMIYSFEWIAQKKSWDGPEEKNLDKEYNAALKAHSRELKKLAKKDAEHFGPAKRIFNPESLQWQRESEIMHPLYEKYKIKFDEHHVKLQEGIDLFAKYFRSFWL